MTRARAFAPGSIGNVGPGFDVLGLALDGIGDFVTVTLVESESRVENVSGIDADSIPREADKNLAMIAARAWLRNAGIRKNVVVSLEKGLPLAGGLGGSAASSVAGAYAAALAAGVVTPEASSIIEAASEAEGKVSGEHLDNIAASVLGGLTLVRSVHPLDIIQLAAPDEWSVALLTPRIRIETKKAREILPDPWERSGWRQQMANTAALVHAFATADEHLLGRALNDVYAEPLRAPMIPRFFEIKKAALDAGAFGCSISGSGPTIFAITHNETARQCADAMKKALGKIEGIALVTTVAPEGARAA
jgi:homoserine kinase